MFFRVRETPSAEVRIVPSVSKTKPSAGPTLYFVTSIGITSFTIWVPEVVPGSMGSPSPVPF